MCGSLRLCCQLYVSEFELAKQRLCRNLSFCGNRMCGKSSLWEFEFAWQRVCRNLRPCGNRMRGRPSLCGWCGNVKAVWECEGVWECEAVWECEGWDNGGLQTPLSILKRIQDDGAKVLVEALKQWKPWIPPKQDQVGPPPSPLGISAALVHTSNTCGFGPRSACAVGAGLKSSQQPCVSAAEEPDVF
jgi:hypothetical protein